ncbi:hypothetical protein [Paraburkholderia ferrariae]|uniref:hypothetical protein n=1 Tax=Paraburkholderia ferrariae TaxID=386056 RepID=UPI0012EC1B72|nr:hypothetical protein [Paraburkholderia ferrariae]
MTIRSHRVCPAERRRFTTPDVSRRPVDEAPASALEPFFCYAFFPHYRPINPESCFEENGISELATSF